MELNQLTQPTSGGQCRHCLAGSYSVYSVREHPGFHVYHRNKQSVTANLRSEEGLALIKRLISVSDVVMSNMTPGVMDRLGLGYDDLKQVRADLVVLTVSTIGQTGPFSQTPSYSPCAGGYLRARDSSWLRRRQHSGIHHCIYGPYHGSLRSLRHRDSPGAPNQDRGGPVH